MARNSWLWLVAGALVATTACGSGNSGKPDGGTVAPQDAGSDGGVDAGSADAGDDAGTPDAGDAGTPDAGLPDGGTAKLQFHQGPDLKAPTELVGPAQGLGHEVVDASLDAAGNLWAVDGHHLFVRRAGLGAVESFNAGDGLSDDEFLSVSGGEPGVAWVGHQGQGDANEDPLWMRHTGGVDRAELAGADIKTKRYELASGPGVYSQYPDGRYKLRTVWRAYAYKQGPYLGAAWFGCNHGTALVSPWLGVEEHHHPGVCTDHASDPDCTLHTGDVPAIAFTPDGDVWFGGTYGVGKLDYTSGKGHDFWGAEPVRNLSLWEKPIGSNEFGSEDITGLALAPDGTLWAGSLRSGLAHLLADNETVEVFQEADGLPTNEIEDIAIDAGGGLWMATTKKGLVRLDLATGEWRQASGLPSTLGRRVVFEQIPGASHVVAVVRGGVAIYPGSPTP